jgi:hypothetical protein
LKSIGVVGADQPDAALRLTRSTRQVSDNDDAEDDEDDDDADEETDCEADSDEGEDNGTEQS